MLNFALEVVSLGLGTGVVWYLATNWDFIKSVRKARILAKEEAVKAKGFNR